MHFELVDEHTQRRDRQWGQYPPRAAPAISVHVLTSLGLGRARPALLPACRAACQNSMRVAHSCLLTCDRHRCRLRLA